MARAKRRYWMTDFQGMNQRQDADKIPTNGSPLLVNIDTSKPGTWKKRKGSDLLATTSAGVGIRGLIDYQTYSGTHALRAVRQGNLDRYDSAGDVYVSEVSSAFTPGTKVQAVNYKNRAYYTSPGDNLQYESGAGSMTTVGSGGNEIRGGTLAVAQNTLFIGQVAGNEDRIYYSLFDTTNNEPGDQLWNDDEGSLSSSTRWFTVLGKNTCLFSYGVTGRVYAFTESACFSFDVAKADNAFGVQKVFDVGCAGSNAVTECNGWMIWMDADARIWAWGGAGPPMPMSWEIEDDANGETVINQVDKSNLKDVAAGTLANEFYFSVGNLKSFGRSLTNVVLKGLISQNLKRVLWSLYTYPVKPVRFVRTVIDNETVLVFGAEAVNDVYRMSTGTSDNGTAITSYGLTAFVGLEEPFDTNEAIKLQVKYRPQSSINTHLYVRYSTDVNTDYTTISDPDNSVVNHGTIDMHDVDSSSKRDAVGVLALPAEFRFRSFSIEVGNDQLDEGFEVSGIAITGAVIELDVLPV